VVWDLWKPWPLRSHSAQVVLDVFAPRNSKEFHRVLRPGGLLLVATPTPRHLQELVGPLELLTVDERKEERLEEALASHFHLEGREAIDYPMELTHAEITAVVAMGPSAHHRDPELLHHAITRLPEPLSVTASFLLSRYRSLS
jgi:23S rRNA (guanine745-N1)-methyltransferase